MGVPQVELEGREAGLQSTGLLKSGEGLAELAPSIQIIALLDQGAGFQGLAGPKSEAGDKQDPPDRPEAEPLCREPGRARIPGSPETRGLRGPGASSGLSRACHHREIPAAPECRCAGHRSTPPTPPGQACGPPIRGPYTGADSGLYHLETPPVYPGVSETFSTRSRKPGERTAPFGASAGADRLLTWPGLEGSVYPSAVCQGGGMGWWLGCRAWAQVRARARRGAAGWRRACADFSRGAANGSAVRSWPVRWDGSCCSPDASGGSGPKNRNPGKLGALQRAPRGLPRRGSHPVEG